jgi:hypothetical protein
MNVCFFGHSHRALPKKAYGFFGLAQPNIFSKNRPDIRVLNHQIEKRRDCMGPTPILQSGKLPSPSPKVDLLSAAYLLHALPSAGLPMAR